MFPFENFEELASLTLALAELASLKAFFFSYGKDFFWTMD